MIRPSNISKQIFSITTDLMECSLCNDQNYPSTRTEAKGICKVDFGISDLSIVLKDREYREIYDELSQNRSYSLKMLDGALVQMMYKFKRNELESHRLAFFPSPYLEEFQNNPEIYEEDILYAEVIKKNIVPFPIRFDFDSRAEVVNEISHPKSHLTLGQYLNCRIPVSHAVTPYVFIDFLLRNFYNTAHTKFSGKMMTFSERFAESISVSERNLTHITIPV